ncbi:DUF2339 domain-containing protein [Rhodopila globiformis]|uniref:DUF2339 domain-containing protein n=1 Tax=Rhodopila globiformis TaxID=1071 RepID=A0A2S6MWW3_RHOGL|nr:DUF2339 domain-containing protein [Rhodopila globiformis]PPQ26855.1 hypothetical protein CCS01_28865 [Rhodopila globiformis]
MFLLFGFAWIAGWVLGIVGFFSALSAHRELRCLRTMLAAGRVLPEPVISADTAAMPGPQPAAAAPPPRQLEPAGPEPEPAVAPPPSGDFEAMLTTRWGIWLGSAALLFAGVFLVRYAVEQELLGPAARCGLAALLGLALLAAAEFLHRHEGPPLSGPLAVPLGSDQAPGGLAAGGTAILFGAAYGAGPFFGLLPPAAAFAAMAAASLIALAASLRYGPLTAATGLIGAFATPALVATETPSLPGLFAWLLVVSAAALLVVRRTGWTWLGWATTVAGALWVCVAGFPPAADRWAAAAFVPAAAALNLLLLPRAALAQPIGRRLAFVPLATLGAAGLLLLALDDGIAPRLALFALSPIAVAKAAAEPRLARLPWVAALLGLLTLLLWSLPAWAPTGEAIRIEGSVQAVLPGAWAPPALLPFLVAASLFAAFHAAAGLWLERRAPSPLALSPLGLSPLAWSALVAAVPVLTLAVAYARIMRFQADATWALAALALSAALTATAAAAMREGSRQRAGVHAAGAVAALALGCAMILHDYWLTLAVALFLPPLAWIEDRADLPALRPVALAVAMVVLARAVLNWYVPGYAFGTLPLVNGLLAGYAAPAASFAVASVLFRRRAADRLVATLEAGAVTFLALFVALEIRHWRGGGDLAQPASLTEAALHLLTVAMQATAYLYLARRTGRVVLDWAWRILGGIALAWGAALIAANPMATGAPAGVADLLAAYLAPAGLAALACRALPSPDLRTLAGGYAVLAGFAWITLQIRQVFHPAAMAFPETPAEAAELWLWSGAWLAYGVGLMVLGIRSGRRALRLTALGVVGLVCVKVFAVDMSDLAGLWRVLSFLGLGLALIGLGVVYRRFVLPGRDGATG